MASPPSPAFLLLLVAKEVKKCSMRSATVTDYALFYH